MLSLSLDMDEEQAQQINLYGELRTQYLLDILREAVIGGIAIIYFGKTLRNMILINMLDQSHMEVLFR